MLPIPIVPLHRGAGEAKNTITRSAFGRGLVDIALGSGLRWTIEQMGPTVAARVRINVLNWLRDNNVSAIETNAMYAMARKR
jgi:hypothetical protein